MPSVRKVKRLQSEPCGDPLVHCSSKCTQQPLVKNAGAITPAESESVNATKPSCHLLLHLLLPFRCRRRYTSNLSVLHVNRRAKGRAADAADTESFSYTRTTKALLCLTACLSLTRCSYFPLPRPSRARDLQPDILHHRLSVLTQLLFWTFFLLSTVFPSKREPKKILSASF